MKNGEFECGGRGYVDDRWRWYGGCGRGFALAETWRCIGSTSEEDGCDGCLLGCNSCG